MVPEASTLGATLASIPLQDLRHPFWFASLGLMLFFFWWIGKRVGRGGLGVLVDSRGKVSLSRFQVCLWTWLILSTILAIACSGGTMDIVVEAPIWALMGISVGSAAGSVIVKGVKRTKPPNRDSRVCAGRVRALAASCADGEAEEWLEGVLHCTRRARFSQIFLGEEAIDHDYVDIAKVQMFLITVALAVGYFVVIWQYLGGRLTEGGLPGGAGGAYALPPLSKEAVTLLGISHGGYLTVKSAPKTPVSSVPARPQ